MQQRIVFIDQLKGFAILMVVMGHVTRHCVLGMDNWIYLFIYSFHMPLFFFVNGLVARKVEISWTAFLSKKFRQLMLPFFCWGILAALYLNRSYADYLFDYFKLGYWYLPVIFTFYVLHLIKQIIKSHVGRQKSFWVDVLIAAVFYVLIRQSVRLFDNNLCLLFSQDHLKNYYLYFYAGSLLVGNKLGDGVIWNVITTICILSCLITVSLWSVGRLSGVMYLIMTISIIATLYMLFVKSCKSHVLVDKFKWLSFIGRHTLSIYMIHFFLYKYVDVSFIGDILLQSNNHLFLVCLIFLISLLMIVICLVGEWTILQSKWLAYLLLGKEVKSELT